MAVGADCVGACEVRACGEDAAAEGGGALQPETSQDEGRAVFWHGKPSFLYTHASAAEHVLLIICFALRSAASVLTEIKSVVQVLCASNASHDQVDPIVPPHDAEVGDRIRFEGFDGEPDAQLNPKKKIFEKLADDLVTNAGTAWIFKHSCKKEHWAHTCMSFLHPFKSIKEVKNMFILFLASADGVAVYKGIPFMTSKGPVTASIPNATVK